jgi:hypothetical protein
MDNTHLGFWSLMTANRAEDFPMVNSRKKILDEFPEKEAQERFEAALRGALKTPATPLKDKPKVKKAKKKRNAK